MFSRHSCPDAIAHRRKKRQITANLSHMKFMVATAIAHTSRVPNRSSAGTSHRHARAFANAFAYCVRVQTSRSNQTRPSFRNAYRSAARDETGVGRRSCDANALKLEIGPATYSGG